MCLLPGFPQTLWLVLGRGIGGMERTRETKGMEGKKRKGLEREKGVMEISREFASLDLGGRMPL